MGYHTRRATAQMLFTIVTIGANFAFYVAGQFETEEIYRRLDHVAGGVFLAASLVINAIFYCTNKDD